MSIELHIRVWLTPEERKDRIKTIEQVLYAVQERVAWRIPEPPFATKWFDNVEISQKDTINPEFKQDVSTDYPKDVIEIVQKHIKPNCAIRISSGFENLTTNCQTSELDYCYRPLDIDLYDPDFGNGFFQKYYGDINLSFYSRHAFSLSKETVDNLRFRPSSKRSRGLKSHVNEWRSSNICVVNKISRNIINRLNPVHLLVTADVCNPVTFSAVYHRHWEDYCNDVRILAKTHKYGAYYFAPYSDEWVYDWMKPVPFRNLSDYGDLRSEYYNENQKLRFLEIINEMTETVYSSMESESLTEYEVFDCLTNDEDIYVDSINDGYFLIHKASPNAYVWRPYISLFNKMYGKSIEDDLYLIK